MSESTLFIWMSGVSYCSICFTLWLYIGEGNGSPLQYSCLENPMDRGAWWAAVHGVTRSRTRLSNFTLTFHFHALEKEMATHSSVLAWRIPGMGEPSGLPSMGSHRVGHDWSDLAAAWSRKDKTRFDSLLLFKAVVQKSLDSETESLSFVAVLLQLMHSGIA